MFMDTAHTSRLYQGIPGSRMLFPSISQIRSHTNPTTIIFRITPIPVITHVQQNISVIQLNRHALGHIRIGRVARTPGLSAILAIRNIGKRHAFSVPSLRREQQRPV